MVGALSCGAKGLSVGLVPVGAHVGGNPHRCFSTEMLHPFFFSRSLTPPLSLKSISTSSGEDFKKVMWILFGTFRVNCHFLGNLDGMIRSIKYSSINLHMHEKT